MIFPRYLKYKASGVEWLGNVPEGWAVSCLKRSVKDIYSGGTPETSNPEYWAVDETDSIPWVAIGDMTRAAVVDRTDKRITRAGLASKRLRILPKGTLLYSMYASLGKVAVLDEPATINQAILGITPDSNKLTQNYLRYWLIQIERHLSLFSSSNTQDNLNAEKVRSLPILVPDREEQTAIAEFLDRETGKIDGLVAEQRRLMELLKEKRQTVISHAVTKGLNPHAPMKPSGIEWLGEVPEHWEINSFRHILDAIGDVDHFMPESVENGVPYLMTGDLMEFASDVSLDDCKQVSRNDYLELSKRIKSSRGDVIMARYATIGTSMYVDIDIEFLVSYSCVTLKTNHSKVSGLYLFHYMKSDAFRHGVENQINTNTQGNVGIKDLQRVKIAVASIDEQIAIAAFLDTELAKFDTLTAEAQRAIDLLQERRTALISAAVTGQIDVR